MSETAKRIVLVGHCGPDSYALKSAVANAIPGAVVGFANDLDSLEKVAKEADLLLINRVLDGHFDTGNGVDLIRELSARGVRPSLMLISNYEDAQAEAQRAGAIAGFGKAQMYTEAAKLRLRSALAI